VSVSLYVPEGTTPIILNSMARIERRLPQPGEIIVREGVRVEAEDLLGRAFIPVSPHVVNVAQALAIPPSQVAQALRHDIGSNVSQGESLANAGFRTCPSPVRGVLVTVDNETGYVTVAPDPEEFKLFANIQGVVMEIFPYEGVLIETPADQLFGVFGVGHERSGLLQLFVTDSDEVITHERIDARSAYSILIGGAGVTSTALIKAVQEQVRGVIVGSIDEQELRAFLRWSSKNDRWSHQDAWQTGMTTWEVPDPQRAPDPGLTIMVTEGFGSYPMSQPVFDLLSSKDRQPALISGTTRLRGGMRRPRLVISMTRSEKAQMDLPRPQLRPEATVRLLDAAHLGQVATVRSVSSAPVRLATGIRTVAVEVVQQEGISFWVPRMAVEVLD
jgi:hypothetical protein